MELIVVITILAILGTIAFISLQGYSANSRDSVRISDMSKMKTSLELFQINAGKYPLPTDGTAITFSGSELVWTQGLFGSDTYNNVDRLDKIPLDPLTGKEYTYSTTNTRQEYSVAGILEGDNTAFNSSLTNEAKAVEKTATLKITGNYNGKLIKTTNYILALPSIIASNGTTVENIVANKWLAYDGYKNLPFSYTGSSYNILADIDKTFVNNTLPSDVIVYEGDVSILSKTDSVGIAARAQLITDLQTAYSGTTIAGVGEIANIIAATDSAFIESLSATIVSNDLGGDIIVDTSSNTVVTYTGPIDPFDFATTCGNGEFITYQQAQNNKAIIISNINNYIGCEINDYPGTNIPGGGIYIAGTTNGNTDVMVVAKEDSSVSIAWSSSVDGTTAFSTNVNDGMANQIAIMNAVGTYEGPNLCDVIGNNFYLPAQSELNTICNNQINLGTVTNLYWSSSMYTIDVTRIWRQATSNCGTAAHTQDNLRVVRCASRV